jgi:hypothetical protein
MGSRAVREAVVPPAARLRLHTAPVPGRLYGPPELGKEEMGTTEYPMVWRWRCRLPKRFGQRCRVLCRGRMNNVCVEFPDGYTVITSRWTVRRA